jgi:hypothetical protein
MFPQKYQTSKIDLKQQQQQQQQQKRVHFPPNSRSTAPAAAMF